METHKPPSDKSDTSFLHVKQVLPLQHNHQTPHPQLIQVNLSLTLKPWHFTPAEDLTPM